MSIAGSILAFVAVADSFGVVGLAVLCGVFWGIDVAYG